MDPNDGRSTIFGLTPAMRLEMVLDYAATVFGDPGIAQAWVDGPHPLVQQGLTPIAVACRTPEGFREAMIALHQIREVARR